MYLHGGICFRFFFKFYYSLLGLSLNVLGPRFFPTGRRSFQSKPDKCKASFVGALSRRSLYFYRTRDDLLEDTFVAGRKWHVMLLGSLIPRFILHEVRLKQCAKRSEIYYEMKLLKNNFANFKQSYAINTLCKYVCVYCVYANMKLRIAIIIVCI